MGRLVVRGVSRDSRAFLVRFGLFKKFKEGLAKTVSAIATKTRGLFGGRKIDATSLEELEEALYTADFGVETTNEILAEIKQAYGKDRDLQGRQAAEIGAAVLKRVLAGSEGVLEGAAASKAEKTLSHVGESKQHRRTIILNYQLKSCGNEICVAQ